MHSWRVVGLVVTAWVVALALLLPGGAEPAAHPSAPRPSAAAPAVPGAGAELARATEVLTDWDARRARAWAADDPRALRRLYAAGSRAGAADVRLMQRWRAAGWRVADLRSQLLGLAVVRATDDRMLLRVVDRVAGGEVVRTARRSALPGTSATARTVELRRGEAGWQVV